MQFVPKRLIINKPALTELMALCLAWDKSSLETMKFIDAYERTGRHNPQKVSNEKQFAWYFISMASILTTI